MAEATAQQCFSEADVDRSGALSYPEFKRWFMKSAHVQDTSEQYTSEGDVPVVDAEVLVGEEKDRFVGDIPPPKPLQKRLRSSQYNEFHALAKEADPEFEPLKAPRSTQQPSPGASKSARRDPLSSPGPGSGASFLGGASEREVAEAVAEARLAMREIMKEEVASLALMHAEEVKGLQHRLDSVEEEHSAELSAARERFESSSLAQREASQGHLAQLERQAQAARAELEEAKRVAAHEREESRRALEGAVAKAESRAERAAKEAAAREKLGLEQQLGEAAARIASLTAMHATLHDQLVELKGNIRVVCRLRPMGSAKGLCVASRSSPFQVTLANKTTTAQYNFDQVFGPSASQSMVFDCVKPLVKSALDGRDVCLLAYGQTGSGKTHTLVGPDGGRIDAAASSAEGEAGMIPRTVHELFALLASQGPGKGAPLNGGVSGPGSVQQVFLTVLEIYNETIRDLLVDPDPKKGPPKVDLRVSSATGVSVPGAMALQVPDAATTLEILSIAAENRATASTDVNDHSSRSHLVVTLRIVTTDATNGNFTEAKLQMVDLAGCERTKVSNVQGAQLTEATAINKSLSALGDVVGALAGKGTSASTLGLNSDDPGASLGSGSPGSGSGSGGGGGGSSKGGKFIPYRNSKLTLLLQDALQPHGKAKVVLFVTASPELCNWNESMSALTFASRCRSVDLAKGQAKNPELFAKAGAAATEAELEAANKKIAELTARLERRGSN